MLQEQSTVPAQDRDLYLENSTLAFFDCSIAHSF